MAAGWLGGEMGGSIPREKHVGEAGPTRTHLPGSGGECNDQISLLEIIT